MKGEYKKVGRLSEREGIFSLIYKDRVDSGDKVSESNMLYKNFDSHHEAMIFIQENNIQLEK